MSEKFDPRKYVIQLKGKLYLETKYRIQWYREDHPKGAIQTEVLSYNPVLVKATVYDNEGAVLATAHAGAEDKGNAVWSGRSIEKGETAAIGRALGNAGYGTQFVGAEDAGPKQDRNGNWRDEQRERVEGNNRRNPPAKSAPPAATAQRTGAPTPPEPPTLEGGDLRDKEVATKFVQRWRSQALTDAEVLTALGVEKLSAWDKGRKAADEAVNTWLLKRINDPLPQSA